VSIAERFAAALGDATEGGRAAPELLPARLALACVHMLSVDGAGLSVSDATGQRIPLGASSEDAATAERLQFTVGAGPCQTSEEQQQPVFAAFDDLRRRWPAFADLLAERTPFRAVVALPLGETLVGRGALDLLFTDDRRVPALDVFEAMAVGDLITSALSDAAVWSPWSPEGGPAFLHTPAAQHRARVWTAIGRVGLARDVDAPQALDLLRAAAWSAGRTVDDLAADVLADRVDLAGLRVRDQDGGGRA
jgi:hypothetical protein